ncbi:MAG: DUF4397 domain-containing protein [Acidobacteria bacterium]|jgi:hypothetical protein|nr:DUF4397 domain-containing protein [Acidobacteriota bacterium]
MIRTAKILSCLLLAATVLAAVGCGDEAHSRLRVVHASPDAPNVDVAVDGKTVLSNVAYETASNYLTIRSGARRVEVRPTGTTTDVINATPSFTKNKDYTVLAVDTVANLAPLLLNDNNSAPAAGQVKLRVVHAAPGAGNVDVYAVPPGTDITTVDPTLSNFAFKAVSDYLSVPAGSYEVFVTPTGTKTVAIDSGTITLSAGQVRTAVALDAPGGGAPFTAILLADLN